MRRHDDDVPAAPPKWIADAGRVLVNHESILPRADHDQDNDLSVFFVSMLVELHRVLVIVVIQDVKTSELELVHSQSKEMGELTLCLIQQERGHPRHLPGRRRAVPVVLLTGLAIQCVRPVATASTESLIEDKTMP